MSGEPEGGKPPPKKMFKEKGDDDEDFSGDSNDAEVMQILNLNKTLSNDNNYTLDDDFMVSRPSLGSQNIDAYNTDNTEKMGEKIEIILYKDRTMGPFVVIIEATENSGNIGR
ncbi:hypothetical protein JTB14_001457 [Gonioctena quinquepunctata]|nr:hypothetical protein JTB14_001457 [Gonioctena quinquepunctata]